MGFLRTGEEVERIEALLSAPHWTGEWLAVQFVTEAETVARLLPPPLQPGVEPLGLS